MAAHNTANIVITAAPAQQEQHHSSSEGSNHQNMSEEITKPSKKRKNNASPVNEPSKLMKQKAADNSFVQIRCVDGLVIVNMSDFSNWAAAGRRAPRYWEVVANFDSEWTATNKNIDLTVFNIDQLDVVHLIKFLRTGHASPFGIERAQAAAICCGGCDALDEFAVKSRRMKHENPMTPKEDIYHLFEWRVGRQENCEEWKEFMVTKTIETSGYIFHFRKKRP